MLILAVIGAVGFFLGALLWVEQAPSPSRFVAPSLNMAVSLALWHWLRGHKERLQTAAWVLEAVCFAVCVSALVLVPNDALRILWLFINIPCVYILLGQRAGAMVTLGSMLLLLAGTTLSVTSALRAMSGGSWSLVKWNSASPGVWKWVMACSARERASLSQRSSKVTP